MSTCLVQPDQLSLDDTRMFENISLDSLIIASGSLVQAGFRSKVDERNEKIGKKIRDAEMLKVPYMLVVGEKDMNENKVSIRVHGKGDVGSEDLTTFISAISKEIATRQLEHNF